MRAREAGELKDNLQTPILNYGGGVTIDRNTSRKGIGEKIEYFKTDESLARELRIANNFPKGETS